MSQENKDRIVRDVVALVMAFEPVEHGTAEAVMRELDEALNPWGAPGKDPDDTGPVWLVWPQGAPVAGWFEVDQGYYYIDSDGRPTERIGWLDFNACVRRRWTPAAPEGTS